MGHMEPCLAQLTILSAVDRAYSTPFLGCSSEAWFEPTLAKSKAWEGFTEGTEADFGEEGAGRASCEVVERDRIEARGSELRRPVAKSVSGSAESSVGNSKLLLTSTEKRHDWRESMWRQVESCALELRGNQSKCWLRTSISLGSLHSTFL